MSEGNVLIEGKEYVSSERAAKLVGYTKDYVGQLARAGKIEAKRIGRSWYIAQASINKHKLSVHYTLTKPKKPIVKNDNTDKIPNENIGKSSILENIPKSEIPNLKEPTPLRSNIVALEDTEEFDLLPRLKEKQRDVLLHTDIRYEDAKEASTQKQFTTVHDPKNEYVKSIPIRKPLKKSSFVTQNRGSHVHVRGIPARKPRVQFDGVVGIDGIRKLDTEKHVRHSAPALIQRKTISKHQKVSRSPLREREKDFEKLSNDDGSKIIPVIGAIVVFTLFVVMYLFVSAN